MTYKYMFMRDTLYDRMNIRYSPLAFDLQGVSERASDVSGHSGETLNHLLTLASLACGRKL